MCFTPPELKEPARAHVASCGAKLLGLTVSVKVRSQLCEAVSRSPAFESVGAERLIKRYEAHGLRDCAPDARLLRSRSLEEIRAQLTSLSQTRSVELIKEKRRQLAQERRQMLLHMQALDDMIACLTIAQSQPEETLDFYRLECSQGPTLENASAYCQWCAV